MNKTAMHIALMLASMSLYAASSQAAEPANPVPVAKDLTAVIALQGLPCGQVVSVKQKGESDYIAKCSDGNEYHVFVNADGRVVVQDK